MDPLTLLREYTINNQLDAVNVVGDQVQFGSQYAFHKTSFTAFKSSRDYETLETVLHVIQTKELTQPDYLKSLPANVQKLSYVERKKLLDYLHGKNDLFLDAAVPAGHAPAPAGFEPAEPASKKAKVAGTREYERQLRDRNTMLVAPSKDFKRVLDIASRACIQLHSVLKHQHLEEQQKHLAKDAPPATRPEKAQQPRAAPAPPKPSTRFDRDTAQDQLKAMGGDAAAALGSIINVYGGAAQPASNQGATDGTVPPPPPPPGGVGSSRAPPPPHSGGAPPSSHAHKPGSGSSQHQKQHHRPGGSSGAAAAAAPGSSRHAVPGAKPGSQAPGAKPGAAGAVVAAGADKLKGAVPIIIVPSGLSSMITMYNAVSFLAEGKFEPTAQAQQAFVARKEAKPVTAKFMRTAGKAMGKQVQYEVTDKPPAKDSPDWGRVVAVIVTGAKWQFKEWPHKGAAQGDMMETFQKVAGFYVHYADEKVADAVTGWNVKRLGIARERRHMDMTLALDFYRHLDEFLLARRSPLAY